jgi:primase-polymerase (primpol)-like protein
MSGSAGDGVGFVLNGDGIVCVDLDGCVSDGRLSAWAEQVVGMFPGAAVEVSLSGRGLHIWGMGPNVSKVFDYKGSRVEVYADKRYIAMTGVWLSHNSLVDLTDGLAEMGLK